MKTKTFLLAFLISTLCSFCFAVGISDTTNGVYLVISGMPPTNELVRFDTPLAFMPFCDTGKVDLIYPTDPAYGVKISLVDSDGEQVAKTHIGRRFGSKFNQLKSYHDGRPFHFVVCGSYKQNMDLGGSRPFANFPVSADAWLRPEDLFEIEKPDIYMLVIQMQMYYSNPLSTNEWHQDLFQFSPIKIKIVKPPEK